MTASAEEEYLRGVQLALAGRIGEAITAFERSLRLDPEALDPHLNLLAALQDAGRWAKADRLAEELLVRWPSEGAVLTAVAKLRHRQGRDEEAFTYIGSAGTQLDPSDPAWPVHLEILLATERWSQAVTEAERGLTVPLRRLRAMLVKAIALTRLGDLPAALDLFERLEAEGFGAGDPLRRGLLPAWVAALRAAGDSQQAAALLAEAVRQHPGDAGLRALTNS